MIWIAHKHRVAQHALVGRPVAERSVLLSRTGRGLVREGNPQIDQRIALRRRHRTR
jgi:hypothetical protein